MYAVYHGPEGLRKIARRVNHLASGLKAGLDAGGLTVVNGNWFDTIVVRGVNAVDLCKRAVVAGVNLRTVDDATVGISLDEKSTEDEVAILLGVFGAPVGDGVAKGIPEGMLRTGAVLEEDVFNRYHTRDRDAALPAAARGARPGARPSMIPLGSCTMKLNATAEMMPLSWPDVRRAAPFRAGGPGAWVRARCSELERWLARVDRFAARIAAAQRRLAGRVRRAAGDPRYHRARGRGGERLPDPDSAPRDEPGECGDGGNAGRAGRCDERATSTSTTWARLKRRRCSLAR